VECVVLSTWCIRSILDLQVITWKQAGGNNSASKCDDGMVRSAVYMFWRIYYLFLVAGCSYRLLSYIMYLKSVSCILLHSIWLLSCWRQSCRRVTTEYIQAQWSRDPRSSSCIHTPLIHHAWVLTVVIALYMWATTMCNQLVWFCGLHHCVVIVAPEALLPCMLAC
jgi:hypothetical protein